ncbi:flagellar biosynthesis protein FlhF [Paraburkholderia bannensis]|uniref:flagellar biosynthesis protein FlhF n=1 Tax=Paraburkholderia bannensis TaxID=765414 RepID=UPI00048957B0|nr:flagellar biosynthesis protein FlhF [Paraburkholderia bannensis]
MNIRKFIGGNSRDALRLVREALGADAVVLSNRTLDDGSVEIVALADSDLAAIAPADAAQLQALAPRTQRPALPGVSTPMSTPMSAGAAAASAAAASFGNPYASGGMPDVFSSVFGASPEVGVEPGAAGADGQSAAGSDDDGDHADDISVSLAQSLQPKPSKAAASALEAALGASAGAQAGSQPFAASRAAAGQAAQQTTMPPTSQTMAASPFGTFSANAASRPVSNQAAAREAAALLEQAVAQPFGDSASAPRTMADTNPWLIDHARRIASQQENTKTPGMSPSAAMAKGLGMTADPVHPADVEASQPQWALEAAHAAARRAARSIGQSADAAGPAPGAEAAAAAASNTAQTVSEAIRSRIEQVVNETVMNELASMRGMMEEQFAGLLWGERQRRTPVQGALTKQLFAAGFSAQLVKMMIERLPNVETEEAGMEWLQSVLESNLPVLEDEEALMERGGVFALMGPTGVGKTTTTAKLAARCVMRFGASKVALLTTDSYRIGGHEQLRIFGKILGVSVHAVRDGADLELALTELKSKHIVLIDTIGMSQRDRAVADQIAMLCGTGRPVQRLLLLSATNHGDTLNEVVQAYQSGPDESPLTGCILTKLDEATNLGSTLDTVLRYKLPVHYVSTGQKVPENLYVATRRFLVRSAFCVPRDRSPFVPHEDDIPALLSALSNRSNSQAHEVRFG